MRIFPVVDECTPQQRTPFPSVELTSAQVWKIPAVRLRKVKLMKKAREREREKSKYDDSQEENPDASRTRILRLPTQIKILERIRSNCLLVL